jgi:hypothetical protein|tara:strand:- start:4131 stop:4469 length:339 start_codon:yes stop_codon:yes gene_type:complete
MIKRENVIVKECPDEVTYIMVAIEQKLMTIIDDATGEEETYNLRIRKPEGDSGENWVYLAHIIRPDGTHEHLDEATTSWAHGVAWQKENIGPDDSVIQVIHDDDDGQLEFWK